MNNSPWLEQLDLNREVKVLDCDMESDLAIVGGGISGVVTAYFALKNTDKKVVLIEGSRLAHGATGHNAGQVIANFEKPFHELVRTYGHKLAIKAKDAIEQAWEMLEEIIADCDLKTPFYKNTGRTGYTNFEDVIQVLELDFLDEQFGLKKEQLLIADNVSFKNKIPKKYAQFYAFVEPARILDLLDSKNPKYIAAGAIRTGCLNSALFVEELAAHLKQRFPKRFEILEKTKVNKVVLKSNFATLVCGANLVICKRVILCTNGFEYLNISNLAGEEINKSFHKMVNGVVGYMAGYKEKGDKPAGTFAYYENGKQKLETPYIYLTRRPYAQFGKNSRLVTIGGPETMLHEDEEYNKDHVYPEVARKEIDQFIGKNLEKDLQEGIDYRFFWHGLMGYTQSGVRVIGPDPINPVLMYNLGCNGVGILTSIYGGKRVVDFLNRRRLGPMIFDPDKR